MSNKRSESGQYSAASVAQTPPPPSSELLALLSVGERQVPDSVARLWEQLALSDRSLILCLEAIVRSVRIDGTAPIDEVALRYSDARARADAAVDTAARAADPEPGSDVDRARLISSVLPGLARSGLIRLPGEGVDRPGASLTISNSFLRVALLEAGLIQLDTDLDNVGLHVERTPRYLGTRGGPQPDGDWSRLWFSVARYDWSTLAVVSSTPGERAIGAASMLADAGHMYRRGVELLDASGVTPDAIEQILASMTGAATRGAQMIVALDCPLENAGVIPIARHASVAMLCVRLGEPTFATVRRTIETIGEGHFVGSVALR